jgi:hypothetical protein
VGSLAPHPTPNLEDQSIAVSLFSSLTCLARETLPGAIVPPV